jgi:hypothetical protein
MNKWVEDGTMDFQLTLRLALLVLCIGLAGCERRISFANDVQPILREHCAECHDQVGEGMVASGFSVRDYNSVMSGTRFGPVIVPGSSISSSLYLMIAEKTAPEIRMPPHHIQSLSAGRSAPLSEDNVEIIGLWIDQGAKDN